MTVEIVNRMRAEEADLLRKLKAVRDFLAVYGEAVETAESPLPSNGSVKKSEGSRDKVELEQFGDYGRKTVVAAMKVLLRENHPVKTRRIVEVLQAAGHEISGVNPINALGALLSRSVDIISHGKAGWSLANPPAIALVLADSDFSEARSISATSNEPSGDSWESNGWGKAQIAETSTAHSSSGEGNAWDYDDSDIPF